ncbi:hypothetical protein AMAG_18721 [Allomyces macrogynus ATCC 38327]|uniref:Uncharacterized protein n=1 Tax=Allomyces macrogynus (strain ATCC 38327) TaxID=578462 RepID=A0A0L0SEX6_ALLM3|nr:hypothetical protein AMAG_18721 [Allomyces macrogynus ATCC 38327]|eukprot:KNE60982.1 hypothetical protein AMAG_18721 [Allomyces macrogynus ATCC 38327]
MSSPLSNPDSSQETILLPSPPMQEGEDDAGRAPVPRANHQAQKQPGTPVPSSRAARVPNAPAVARSVPPTSTEPASPLRLHAVLCGTGYCLLEPHLAAHFPHAAAQFPGFRLPTPAERTHLPRTSSY